METTRAGINDEQVLPAIHAGLKGSDLLPEQRLVDAGYVDAANLLQSQQYGVDPALVQFVTIIGGKPIQSMTLLTFALIGKRKP